VLLLNTKCRDCVLEVPAVKRFQTIDVPPYHRAQSTDENMRLREQCAQMGQGFLSEPHMTVPFQDSG
jgi:hypothetical protein